MKLLQGAADRPNDVKYKVMENYCIMHSGEKSNIERALESFIQLDSQYVCGLNLKCMFIQADFKFRKTT
jgi:hypothetical protein